MRFPWKVAPLLLAVLSLQFLWVGGVVAVAEYPLSTSDTAIEDALDYLRGEQESDGRIVDYGTTCWVVCAVVAADEDPADWDYAGDSLVDYLEAEADSLGSAFDYALAILAAVAAGEDPTSFGGVDLVAALEDEYTGGQLGDTAYLNDDFWGLIALVAAGDDANSTIVSNVRDFIVSNQSSDPADYGSWSWGVGETGDVDDTAAAIMALMATGTNTSSSVISDGLAYLADNQDTSGGFLSWGSTNADTNSWAILAIASADEDPGSSSWEVSGNTPVDDLLSFQQPTGEFYWQTGDPGWNTPKTTASAIQALLGVPWPVEIWSPAVSSGDAVLAVSPLEFESGATENGADPLDRTLEIWNIGDGTLEWEVESDEDWLDLSPSSGSSTGERDEVTLSFDISGLVEDTYYATITITAPGADDSPQTVDVTLEIGAGTVDPEIAFAPSSLDFTAEEGGDDPTERLLEIWNPESSSIDFEVESDEDWLDVSPSDGTCDDAHEGVIVSVDIGDLDVGDYEATITITSSDADNSPQTVDVTLEVTGNASQDAPEIDFSPSRLSFEATEGGDDPDSKTIQIWNVGDGRLSWAVSADEDWLSLSPRSGTSNGEKDSVEVSVDISDLDEGDYSALITLENEDDSRNEESVRVTLVIEAADTEEPDETDGTYLLVTSITPEGAGTITRSVNAADSVYPGGTTVTLTAVASPGFAFTGWSGDAAGSEPVATVVMNSPRSVMAGFVRFDASGLTNVVLTYAPPELNSLTVVPYPVASIPSSPPKFRLLSAYVVQPKGSGAFTLRFDALSDANNVAVFQVVSGTWAQVPRSVVSQTSVQVTIPAADTVLALAYPGSSQSSFLSKVTGLFVGADSTTIIVVVVAAVLVALILLVVLVFGRRESY